MIINVFGLEMILTEEWPYLDKDGLPEAFDWTIRIVLARSSFFTSFVGAKPLNGSPECLVLFRGD